MTTTETDWIVPGARAAFGYDEYVYNLSVGTPVTVTRVWDEKRDRFAAFTVDGGHPREFETEIDNLKPRADSPA